MLDRNLSEIQHIKSTSRILHWTANAITNSAKRPSIMVTTHQGKASKAQPTVVHSAPYFSVKYPLKGEANH